jgi:hypothetical protein
MKRWAALLLLSALALPAVEFEIRDWVDTGIELKPGDAVRIAATGRVMYTEGGEAGPLGTKKTWKDLLKTFPVNTAGRGAVVARIGDGPTARPFLVGELTERTAPVAGRLFLGLNHPKGEKPDGAIRARVEVRYGSELPPIDESQLPRLTQDQLDSLPPRVVDDAGTEGDRVNFVILGEEHQIVKALESVGWVQVDRSNEDAVVSILNSVAAREGYVRLPMSTLLMFDRGQDYGFALGDPLIVVAARHHFRLWRAPFDADGAEVWVGAGTHDVGFDKDQRNGKLTHKIDSDTDKEREFIGESLKSTGQVALTYYLTRENPVTKANTAHGQEFYSDGQTLIIVMRPAADR